MTPDDTGFYSARQDESLGKIKDVMQQACGRVAALADQQLQNEGGFRGKLENHHRIRILESRTDPRGVTCGITIEVAMVVVTTELGLCHALGNYPIPIMRYDF